MKAIRHSIMFATILCGFSFLISCKEVVAEFDCGPLETKIEELSYSLGSYSSSTFSSNNSTNYEDAAIRIQIDLISFMSDKSCFTFSPLPQVLESVNITSSDSVVSNSILYLPGEELSEIFKIHSKEQTYSIADFVEAHVIEPTIFHAEPDEIVLQLNNEPDSPINQAFTIQFKFDDSENRKIEVPFFEVSN